MAREHWERGTNGDAPWVGAGTLATIARRRHKATKEIALVRQIATATLLTALIIGSPACAEEEVGRWTGFQSGRTDDFKVEGPWILDWRINTDVPQAMSIEISLINAISGFRDGVVLKSKYRGNGVKLFNEGGRFRFRVDSVFTNWDLKVRQLTPEEAELYTPRVRD